MFSQRKTECHPTVIPFHGISTYDLVCWGKLLESMNCNAAPMWRFLCAKQFEKKCWSIGGQRRRCVGRWALRVGRWGLVVTLFCQSAGKKLAWTDLDWVDFEKIFQRVNVQIEKSAWTGLRKNKKASSAASVFKISSRLATDLTLARGAVDATPVAVAVSLTFSLVKN